MKKSLILLILTVSAMSGFGQEKADSGSKADAQKDFVRTAADLKSGNSQEVLSSFFQLGFKDLRDGRQFQFSSSIFAIKAKADDNLWIDTTYLHHVFDRNFVFGFNLGADSAFKFNSLSVKAKYAIINHRDKDIYQFAPELDRLLFEVNELFRIGLNRYWTSKPDKAAWNAAKHFYHPGADGKQTPIDDVPAVYKNILEKLKLESGFELIKDLRLDEISAHTDKMYQLAADKLAQRSLLTVGAQFTIEKRQFFSRGNLNLEYLKGMTESGKRMGLELDIKANIDFYDSISVSKTFHRSVFSSSAGINWIIYKSKATEKSYVELKPSLTYNNVLGGLLPGETRSKFTGDGVLRFRITDDLWLPIDIKYDPDAKKIFGFLNITANFDWLGKKSKN